VPDLADDRFDTQAGYEEFLSANPEPVDFLENKLLFSEDRFTFYSDDYNRFSRIALQVYLKVMVCNLDYH